MTEILGIITALKDPPWIYISAPLAIILTFGPRLLEFYRSWLDLRIGRRSLLIEKERLTLLKLRYEIEALKTQHTLPEIEVELGSAVTAMEAPTAAPAPEPATPDDSAGWGLGWMSRATWLLSGLLWSGQVISILFVGMFALSIVVVPAVFFTSAEMGAGEALWASVVLILVYGLLAYLSYRLFKKARATRHALRQST